MITIECDNCLKELGKDANTVVPYKIEQAFEDKKHFCSVECILIWAKHRYNLVNTINNRNNDNDQT